MEESWEEKAERLEREYQARIDRLREELREMEEQKLHMGSLFEERVRQHEQIEYTNAALKARVAELERDNTRMKNAEVVRGHTEEFSRQLLAELDEVKAARSRLLGVNEQRCKEKSALSDEVMALQSQLEWTPVSAGLPTAPGLYEVLWNGNEITGPFSSDEIAAFPESMRALWTNYRRVELPKDGET